MNYVFKKKQTKRPTTTKHLSYIKEHLVKHSYSTFYQTYRWVDLKKRRNWQKYRFVCFVCLLLFFVCLFCLFLFFVGFVCLFVCFLPSPAISLGFTLWVRFLRMWPFFNPTIKVVTSRLRGWMRAGCVFVAGIHPSRTWMSGSFESVRWNACVHRLGILSSERVLVGMEFEPMLTPGEKSTLPESVPRGGSSPSTTNWAIPAPQI